MASDLLSFGDLRKATNLPTWRLRYLLETRGISPACRVAGRDLYSPASVERVRQAAREAEGRRFNASRRMVRPAMTTY